MIAFLAQLGLAAIGLCVGLYLFMVFLAIILTVFRSFLEGVGEVLSWLGQRWFWQRVAITIGIFSIAILSMHFTQ